MALARGFGLFQGRGIVRIAGVVILAVLSSCTALCSLLVWAASSNVVGQVPSFAGVGEAKAAAWSIQASGNDREIKFSVDCRGISAVQVEGGYSLRIPGQSASISGTPDVPHLAKLFPGMKGVKAHVLVQGLDPTNIVNVSLAAAEGFTLADAQKPALGLRAVRQPDAGLFGSDQFWPVELGRVAVASIGTQNVVRVECFPVQYNPVTRTLRFYRRLEGILRFEPR